MKFKVGDIVQVADDEPIPILRGLVGKVVTELSFLAR